MKWLDDRGLEYETRDIKENNPDYDELKKWHRLSGLSLRKFFNTSGLVYKELGLKDKLDSLSEDEQLKLLAEDGMLVKRPLLILEYSVLAGFREDEWNDRLSNISSHSVQKLYRAVCLRAYVC